MGCFLCGGGNEDSDGGSCHLHTHAHDRALWSFLLVTIGFDSLLFRYGKWSLTLPCGRWSISALPLQKSTRIRSIIKVGKSCCRPLDGLCLGYLSQSLSLLWIAIWFAAMLMFSSCCALLYHSLETSMGTRRPGADGADGSLSLRVLHWLCGGLWPQCGTLLRFPPMGGFGGFYRLWSRHLHHSMVRRVQGREKAYSCQHSSVLRLPSFARFVSNKFLRKPSTDQRVEWAFCFDVHCNAFFPLLLILHVVQLFLIKGMLSSELSRVFRLYLSAS